MSPGRASAAPGVEIVTIGDELLLGETVDGNSAWLGRRLAAAGVRVLRRATVGDDAEEIRFAVGAALGRAGAVVCSGGLGPTPDDLTRAAVADLFGRAVRVDDEVLATIRRRFDERGHVMPAVNRRQAEVPEGARVFPNTRGTAPGIALEDEAGRFAVLLPGVPFELHALVEDHVLDYILERLPGTRVPIVHRVVRTTGIAESALAERIEDLPPRLRPLTLAFLPAPTGVDIRLTSWGALDADEVGPAFDAAEQALRERLEPYVYGRDDLDIAAALAERLRGRALSLAVAESCTGGLAGKRLTDLAGASEFFLGGVVAYHDALKTSLLDVPEAELRRYGAVSEEAARAMAVGARTRTGADTAIAITGVAGPGGGTAEKPVGTVWVAAAYGDAVIAERHRFPGDREEIRERAAQAALALLWLRLAERLAE